MNIRTLLFRLLDKKDNTFYLNTTTITHHKKHYDFKTIIKKVIALLFIIGIMGWIGLPIFFKYNNTPKEQLLSHENAQLLIKYELVCKDIDSLLHQLERVHSQDDSVYRALLGLKKEDNSIWQSGIGGVGTVQRIDNLSNKELVVYTEQKLSELKHKVKLSKQSYQELFYEIKKHQDKLQHMPAIMPIENRNLKHTGSGFGMRYHPILNISRMHEGIDFIADKGTPIFASGRAIVEKRYLSKTFGNVLILDHGYGFESLYAHLSAYNVLKGQEVNRGDTIGFMGSTGLSSGVHLHYEIHLHGKEIDPIHYFYNDLGPEQYQQIIDLANSFDMSLD